MHTCAHTHTQIKSLDTQHTDSSDHTKALWMSPRSIYTLGRLEGEETSLPGKACSSRKGVSVCPLQRRVGVAC